MSNTNIGLNTPPNGDPSVRNSWGTNPVNLNMGIIDNYTAGQLIKSVAGSADVVLTYTVAAVCESVHSHFNFTGVLTGNITVFYPQGIELNFSAQNNTTGSFTLTLAADDGSHSPAGDTIEIANGGAISMYRSDGTNVVARASSSVSFPIAVNQGGTGANTATAARTNLAVPGTADTNTFTGTNLFSGSQKLQVNAGDAGAHPVAFINMTGATQYSGRITWGSAAPGVLQTGEIYLQTS